MSRLDEGWVIDLNEVSETVLVGGVGSLRTAPRAEFSLLFLTASRLSE